MDVPFSFLLLSGIVWSPRFLLTKDMPMPQFFDKVSLAIGHTARVLTLLSFYLLTALIAALTLLALLSAPFEYTFSQDDLALADVVSLILLGVVSWRFFRRGGQSGLSGWALVKRFSFSLTYTTLICVAVLALFLSAAYFDPEIIESDPALTGGYEDLLTYGLTGLFLAVIYGATPLRPLFSRGASEMASDEYASNNTEKSSDDSPEPPTLKPETGKEPM